MSITTPLISIKNVGFTYSGNAALQRVSFDVMPGDYIGIIGPNGGGKTTLLKILVGLLQPQTGHVEINGVPAKDYPKKYEIGYVPQRIAQDTVTFPATVSEVVESGRLVRKKLFQELDETDRLKVRDALATAGIADLEHRLMSTLSGGQRQRVYVARALASEPRLLILDEPFVGVDIATQKEFYSFLKQLNEQRELTIMFVSHDIDVVTQEAKSILCLNRTIQSFGQTGTLAEQEAIAQLYGQRITHLHHSPDAHA